KEYSELFDGDDFKVESSAIEATTSNYTVDEAFGIFESGAAAGYLNQDYYTSGLSQEYIEAFKNILRKSLIEQSDEQGNVPLIFYRIYLLAIKSG
ncbi:MAG: class I SAM-dependent methyltransferase, partial [Actinobacteria bacterium]|nr:class I SAM-dependent methyltransferase [Actinomycetota bacterium]